MKLHFSPRLVTNFCLALVSCLFASQGSLAVELLVSGDFEAPGGVGDIPGWTLEQFITGSGDPIGSAEITSDEDVRLFLRPFVAGGPLTPSQGNFDNDGLPAGDVDGKDFLTWQRNSGLMGTALPEQGDANGDTNVDSADLGIWEGNYGVNNAGRFINARLTQVVPGVAGETYTFQGTSEFEDFYSGWVTTLNDASPNGQIASPTVTQFRMEFLDSGGNVIGSPSTLDLRPEQFPGFPIIHSPLVAQAPAGTTDVRVVAEALDMAWNGASTQEMPGFFQSAYFNDFSLKNATDPSTDLLTNGDLNLGSPDALDFWNQVEDPESRTQILRAETGQAFSNYTAGGLRGVWLSAFFGSHPIFEATPVDGSMSQTVEAVAGGTYTFSGWTLFEANYSGGVDTIDAASPGFLAGQPSPTETEIRLEFLNINGDVIDSAVIDVKEAREADPSCGGNANSASCGVPSLGAGGKDFGWIQHTLQAVAPPDTRFARLTAQMIDGVFNIDPGQSAFFDEFSLDGPSGSLLALSNVVPEPTSVALLALGLAAIGLRRVSRMS